MHEAAGERFRANPLKSYQRHIRELYAETEPREQLESTADARVVRITNEQAKTIILKFEWLRHDGLWNAKLARSSNESVKRPSKSAFGF